MKKLFIVTTLALGTATITTGCDKLDTGLMVLATKASALEGKLMDAVGPRAKAFVAGLEQRLTNLGQPRTATKSPSASAGQPSVAAGAGLAVFGPDGGLGLGVGALGDLANLDWEQLGEIALRELDTWFVTELEIGLETGLDTGADDAPGSYEDLDTDSGWQAPTVPQMRAYPMPDDTNDWGSAPSPELR